MKKSTKTKVFLKQEQRGTCTLASTAMMLRRAALLNGDENWAQITEASCRQAFWIAGCGLPYNFSYGEMTVSHDTLPGGEVNKDILMTCWRSTPRDHAPRRLRAPRDPPHRVQGRPVLLRRPLGVCRHRHHPHRRGLGHRVENSNAYWYVTSQVADVQEEEDLALPQVTVETSVEDLLLPLFLQDVEEETCLIGQALETAR